MTDDLEPRKHRSVWWPIAAILILAGGCAALFSGGDDSQGQSSASIERADAERVCEEFVKDRLKAPATAEFGDATTVATVIANYPGYKVINTVDAENSFGAPIRSTYTCEVRSGGPSWHLESLTGLG